MKCKNNMLLSILGMTVALILFSCGNGSSNNNSSSDSHSESYSDSSSESNIGQYAGKWELFQVGNSPNESAIFTLTIHSNGDASISHYARIGYSETCLESGDGYAELNGDVLFVEITSGKSRGTTLRLIARDGKLYDADGEPFSKSY